LAAKAAGFDIHIAKPPTLSDIEAFLFSLPGVREAQSAPRAAS